MKSTPRITLIAISILLLTASVFAQEAPQTVKDKFTRETTHAKPLQKEHGFWKPFHEGFTVSTALYWSGVLADLSTSQGKDFYEGNPRLRNSRGGLDNGKALAISGAIYALTLPLEKKYSKAMAVLRIVMGGVHFGVAGYNHLGAR